MGTQVRTESRQRRGFDELFSVTYEELRRLASAIKRDDPAATLNPTALVNEVWLKMASSPLVTTSPIHFKRIAARAMRQVLVEAARRRNSLKRGGGQVPASEMNGLAETTSSPGEDLLALNDVLEELERLEPRQAALVESRFFGGLDIAEIALLLEISETTVNREWKAARAWLKHRLRQRV